MKRILLLTYYYPPDLGPGALRAKSIVDALLSLGNENIHIDILTTMPNRYHTHSTKATLMPPTDSISIQRFAIPEHRSGMADQAMGFIAFARQALSATRNKRWDVVVATSSRLMTAAVAARVSRRTNTALYLDIRDLFTDAMNEMLSASPLRIVLPALRRIERYAFQSAKMLNVVSPAFVPHINNVAPHVSPTVHTNGIDEDFLGVDYQSITEPGSLPLVVYAGNIGEGQGLHRILPRAAKRLEGKCRFRVIGDGGRKDELIKAMADVQPNNLELVDPVPRSELVSHYREAQILFLHLNDYRAFQRVLPSKIFEYAATGKPILAGVSGHAADFLEEHVAGTKVFRPCNQESMLASLDELLAGPKSVERAGFCEGFSRGKIMGQLAADVLST